MDMGREVRVFLPPERSLGPMESPELLDRMNALIYSDWLRHAAGVR